MRRTEVAQQQNVDDHPSTALPSRLQPGGYVKHIICTHVNCSAIVIALACAGAAAHSREWVIQGHHRIPGAHQACGSGPAGTGVCAAACTGVSQQHTPLPACMLLLCASVRCMSMRKAGRERLHHEFMAAAAWVHNTTSQHDQPTAGYQCCIPMWPELTYKLVHRTDQQVLSSCSLTQCTCRRVCNWFAVCFSLNSVSAV